MKFNPAILLSAIFVASSNAAPIAQAQAQADANAVADPEADAYFRWFHVSNRFGIFARDESSANTTSVEEEPVSFGIAIPDDNSTEPIIIPLYEGEEDVTEEDVNKYLAAYGFQDESELSKREAAPYFRWFHVSNRFGIFAKRDADADADADAYFRWFHVSNRFGIFARDEDSSNTTLDEQPVGYGIAIGENSTEPIVIPLFEGEEDITEEQANKYLSALGIQDSSDLSKRDAAPYFRWFKVSNRFGIFAKRDADADADADAYFRWFHVSNRFGIFAKRDANAEAEAEAEAAPYFRWFHVSNRFGIFARDEDSTDTTTTTSDEKPVGYGIAISENSTEPIVIPLFEGEEDITEEQANEYLSALGIQDSSDLSKRDAAPYFRWFKVSNRFGIFA